MRIHRVLAVTALAAALLSATALPAAQAAPPSGTYWVDFTLPNSYPACAKGVGVDFGWAHLQDEAQSKNVYVVVFILENDTELLRYTKVAPSFFVPTSAAANSSYQPNWRIEVIIYPGTDTSSPAIRYTLPSPQNVPITRDAAGAEAG